jgi:uncharacterized repeat protein (TIGR03803 family)
MKPLGLRLLLTSTAVALLNACGASPPSSLPAAGPEGGGPAARGIPDRATFNVLHDFGDSSSNDGLVPLAKLTSVDGVLFGTTEDGGSFTLCSTTGCGTVFSVTTSGKEQVVYNFGSASGDGLNPSADLTDVSSTLYGTTQAGGAHGEGTVYSITSGKEQVVYSFGTTSNDGSEPMGGLLDIKGTLYGTTYHGGAYSHGTVFSVTPKGKERVLYSFGHDYYDAAYPSTDLLAVGGTLYGTTFSGGANQAGTVFGVTRAGKERIVHSFGGSSSGDGSYPESDLIEAGGVLYGTTGSGGAHNDGTVFSMSTHGKEQIIYSFGAKSGDGTEPGAGLLSVGGTMYGTTSRGGNGKGCPYQSGCGTVFSVDGSGMESILYSFSMGQNAKDGAYPSTDLVSVNGVLYGTTPKGGTGNCQFGLVDGCGTVFAVNP